MPSADDLSFFGPFGIGSDSYATLHRPDGLVLLGKRDATVDSSQPKVVNSLRSGKTRSGSRWGFRSTPPHPLHPSSSAHGP